WLLRSDGELFNWYTQNEWVRWGGEAINYGPGGGAMRWSKSSHDLGGVPRRSEKDLEMLRASLEYVRSQGAEEGDVIEHGLGTDASLVAIAKALDIARLQGGHGDSHDHTHDHSHDHSHDGGDPLPGVDWGADPASLEHPDERTDERSHNWGAGRAWKQGDPIPAPILSTLPVRSRSR